MIWVFIIIGSFLLGAFIYVAWLYGLKVVYIKIFKRKQIIDCKNHLRILNLTNIPPKEKVDIYVADSKIQSFEAKIITEAEKLYFEQKPFDDLVEYLQQKEFYFDDVFHTKFIFLQFLNKNHEIVKTLLENGWNKKTIKKAFKFIERGLKTNGRTKKRPIIPGFKEQIEQDFEKSKDSGRRGDGSGESRTISNESGTSGEFQGFTPKQRKLSVGKIAPKRESTQRKQEASYWDRFGA